MPIKAPYAKELRTKDGCSWEVYMEIRERWSEDQSRVVPVGLF